MRRLIIALLLVALAAGGVATIAIGNDSKPTRSGDRAAKHRAHRGHHGLHGVIARAILRSYAQRLGVEPQALRKAIREIAREQRRARLATLTAAERRALRACHRAHHRRATNVPGRKGRRARCDRAAAHAALKKLKDSIDLAALKTELSDSLAARLGLTSEKVLEAARAELVARLDQGVKLGFVTEKGRILALGCFDAPADCELEALRAEFRLPGHHGMHRRR